MEKYPSMLPKQYLRTYPAPILGDFNRGPTILNDPGDFPDICVGAVNEWYNQQPDPSKCKHFPPEYKPHDDGWVTLNCRYDFFCVGEDSGPYLTYEIMSSCPEGYERDASVNFQAPDACKMDPRKKPEKNVGTPPCESSDGNPIDTRSGNKFQREIDYEFAGPHKIVVSRSYNSRRMRLAPLWTSNYFAKIVQLDFPVTAVLMFRPDGLIIYFRYMNGAWSADSDESGHLTATGFDSVGRVTGWLYRTKANEIETFNIYGYMDKRYQASGMASVSIVDKDGRLMSVMDSFGRSFSAAPNDGKLFSYLDPEGFGTSISYPLFPDRPESITFQDGGNKSYQYDAQVYGDVQSSLIAIVDEEQREFARWGYDYVPIDQWQLQAFAKSSQHGAAKERVELNYLPDGTVLVRSPLGAESTKSFTDILGARRLTSQSKVGGSGCAASAMNISHDINGNISVVDDFVGNRSCSKYDLDRNLKTVEVEGLPTSQQCGSVLNDNAALPPNARKIIRAWHPVWNLEIVRAEPLRITTTVYNGQVDPISSSKVNCVPEGTPLLPDGSDVAVVCRRYEHATIDITGSQGFSAVRGDSRHWEYTYNSVGQVLTELDPNGNEKIYEYWNNTLFNGTEAHTMGDLKSLREQVAVVNGAKKYRVTNYLSYDKAGRVKSTQLPNGALETRTYTARGWLETVGLAPSTGGLTQQTRLEYYKTGLLKKATRPDGHWTQYTYNDAHWLTDTEDSAGNKVHYEHDNMGNVKLERYSGADGNTAREVVRDYDALGRLQSVTGVQ